MTGAKNLNPEHIKGRILINMDSEEEGQLLVSCAGGVRLRSVLKIDWEQNIKENFVCAEIKIRGLKGGHSGMEINKGRGNSNKIIGRILYDILNTFDFRLISINGGNKDNVIPREAYAEILIKKDCIEDIKLLIDKWNKILQNEFKISDPYINVDFNIVSKTLNKVFSKESTKKAIEFLYLIPNGVQTMSMEIEGLVESSINLGAVKTDSESVHFNSAARSCVRSLKEDIVNKYKITAEAFNAEFYKEADYPEWKYNPNSKIKKLFQKVYKDLYGREPEIVAIHAGVECGLFEEKFGEIDMISFGPNIYDVHTPNENMSISSVQRTWKYLLAVLKEIK